MIDEALRKSFERDGFLHLPGYMTSDEMDEIEKHYERALRDVVPSLSKSDAMYEDYSRPETLKQVNVDRDRAPFLSAVTDQRFQDLLCGLLDQEVTPQSLEFFIKPPKEGTPTPPHQDGYYFCLENNLAATAWLTLDDMDDENGTLHYVAGSHRFGIIDHQSSDVLGFSQGLTESDLSTYGEDVACQLTRGDLLVHHCLTIHRAEGNPSDRLRRAFGAVYYGASDRLDEAKHQRYRASVDRQQKEMGVL